MLLPFGELRPDVSSYNQSVTGLAQNVLPRADGYGPFKQFGALTRPLAEGNDTFTKILLHFDGADAATTFTDSNAGGSAHTWTAAGNAQLDTAQLVFGTASLLLDGTGDWITTADHADFTLADLAWTVECRIRPAVDGSSLAIFGQGDNTGSASSTSIRMFRNATNGLTFQVSNGTTYTTVSGSSTAVVAGAWYHVRVVHVDATIKMYLNGALDGSASFSATVNDSSNAFRIGAAGEVTSTTFNGWIDEFRLDVGGTGAARNTAAFTPPTKAYDAPANGTCRGMFYARKSDGSVVAFAGTSDATNGSRLWRLDNTALDWVNVTISTGYAALPASYHWQFEQKGNFVVAVKPSNNPQVFDLSSSTTFSDLSGSPPQAAYARMVGNKLVLSGLTSFPFRVQWSDEDDITNWSTGLASSQDFPEGGIVRGIAGGEMGYVFQDAVIRRMTGRFGDSLIAFEFDKISDDLGLLAPYSIARAGERVAFLSQKGWHVIVGNGYPTPIGKEKFDRTFFSDYDRNQLQLIIAAGDPEGSRFFFAYKSGPGASGLMDKIIIYDYLLERPSYIVTQALEFISTFAAPGLTLEGLDPLFPNLDLMTVSLDDIALSQLPKISAFDSTHSLGLFGGQNLEATTETPERELDDFRVRVQGARMITDAPTCYLSIGVREANSSTVSYTTEQAMDSTGWCPANVSTRLARGRVRIPAGTTWTHKIGIDPTFRPEGRRR